MSTVENPWPQPSEDERAAPSYAIPSAPAPSVVAGPRLVKDPKLAAFLSLFPGVGNVYNGLYVRGLTQFLIVASLIELIDRNGRPLFGLGIAFFWIFNILDAYRQAVLINYGYSQDLGLLDKPARPLPGQGGIVAGVILLLIGVISLLDRYVNISLDWVFDLWPVVMVLLGVWLIWGSIRDRRRASSSNL